MTFVLLIRHAENDFSGKKRLAGRLADVHLNDSGKEQAQRLAKTLAGLPLKAIYSSPLERAIETAQPIAEQNDLKVIPHDGLIEIDYGDWQGQSLKSLYRTKLWKTVQHAPAWLQFPNGETLLEAQYRISRTLREIAAQYEPKDWIACVSHADPIKLAIAHFLSIPLEAYQRLTIGLASITVVHLDAQGARLLTVNHDPLLMSFLTKQVG
ncbi:MAG: histidine phosphatase family protein [Anaerolineales bacterium]